MKQRITLWMGLWTMGMVLEATAADYTVTSALDDGSEGTLRYFADSVASGSTIYVPEGMTVSLGNAPIVTRFKLSIVGQGSGATIRGNGTTNLVTGTVPTYNLSSSLSLQNLTFTNGFAAGNGAVFRFGNTSYSPLPVHFLQCRFLGNHAVGAGGILNESGGSFVFTDCLVAGNTAGNGAVIGYNNNGYTTSGVYYATNTVFASNVATNGGGGVFGKNWNTLQLVGCVVSNNTSSSGGAFVATRGDYEPVLTYFEDCHFVDNTAGGEGGLFAGGIFTAREVTFKDCLVRRNTAPRASLISGSGRYTFDGCLVESNTSHTAAGWYSAGLIKTQLSNGGSYNYLFSDCVVRGNSNTAGENAILWTYGTPTAASSFVARDSLFDGNFVSSGTTLLSPGGYTLALENVTFANNGQRGGNALFSTSGLLPVALTNCTFHANRSGSASLLYVNSTGVVDLVHCTVVSNTLAAQSGNRGALFNNKGSAVDLRAINSVVAGNLDGNGTVADVYGSIPTLSHCAFSGPAGSLDASTSRFGLTGAQLALGEFGADGTSPLLYGNEPLPTVAIGRTSVLRDAGTAGTGVSLDARGMARDAQPDLGAYEYIVLYAPTLCILR